jgi:2-polyprenyl-6-hydroxyphenyl methylase/3-demethylubiquinone-9 3-methyltransferase
MLDQKSLVEKSFWDAGWAIEKSRRINLHDYQSYRIARLFDQVLPRGPVRTIEIGAGNSAWLPYMTQKFNHRVIGVDYSKIGCDLLKLNLGGDLSRASVIQGDMFQNCFAPAVFDVVFSNGLIEHFPNYIDILSAFKQMLKPNGLLITFVPNKKYFFRHIEKRLAPDVYAAHILFEPAILATAYQKIGMSQIQAAYFGSFSTWKYNSYAHGLTKRTLQFFSRILSGPVQTFLRVSNLEPESRAFSPIIMAIGRLSA